MLKKVLIANRGEIACRIIRTLDRMGIASVAVFHHEDRNAPHVQAAGERVQLHSDVPTAAYLDSAQLLAACASTGADAVHPGYGFLSENSEFSAAVSQAGLVFIGPAAETIHLMGDKIRARTFAADHGVPVAPSAVQTGSIEEFERNAAGIGFPLLIKAAAGGGGKGMKIVHSAADLKDSVRVAASEAQRYFSDGRVYAEKLVIEPRHIEVQVLGDGNGKVVHLLERECSIQRRYQKVVEECPAPNMPDELRARILQAATRLACAAKYRNAGTIEFVLGADGEFYFLEMNTRLQVEHPVTEMVLGLDIVEQQVRIASGQALELEQDKLIPVGHAIEVRICAERPEKDFQPATGRVGLLRVPQGQGLRFDGGIREGQIVTSAFDSMLAKLVAHGDTRDQAADRLQAALRDLAILGVSTNIDFLGRVMSNSTFRSGKLHTGFIAQEAAQLLAPQVCVREDVAAVVAALIGDTDFRTSVLDTPEPYASIGSWNN